MNTHVTETQVAGFIAWRLSPLINVVQYQALLKRVGEPGKLLENPALADEFPALKEKLRLRALRHEARTCLRGWREQGIGVLVLGGPDYPPELLTIPDPPFLLTFRGAWSQERMNVPRLSIVGSRRADSEGTEIARHFASALAQRGVCIVSGLALGIDGAAHRGAISAAHAGSTVPTVAVCGNGLMQVYPRAHLSLARELLESGGVLLSQFDPQEPPYPVNFLNRNRIVAALSAATLVIQASDKSGSLVTARHALEYGKELFIVPGSIRDPRYLGSNRLLQHGAHLATGPQDIFETMPEYARAPGQSGEMGVSGVSEQHRWLFQALLPEDRMAIDDLYAQSPEPEQFFEQLLLLELDGVITRHPGNQVSLSTAKRLEFSNNPL